MPDDQTVVNPMMPLPRNPASTTTPKELDQVDLIKKEFYDGQRLNAFRLGAGMPAPVAPTAPAAESAPTEKLSTDVGAVVKAQGETINTLLQQLITVVTGSKGQPDPQWEFMKMMLTDAKDKLDNAPDPVQAVLHADQVMEAVHKRIQEKQGIMAGGAQQGMTAAEQANLNLRLEEMRETASERDRQWQFQMLTTKREWQLEDRRFNYEVKLKSEAAAGDREIKKEALSKIGGLATAIGKSVQMGEVGFPRSEKPQDGDPQPKQTKRGRRQPRPQPEAEAEQPAGDEEQDRVPEFFICHMCGESIDVPEDVMELVRKGDVPQAVFCQTEGCGAEYAVGDETPVTA